MPNPNKAKGSAFERAVINYLRDEWRGLEAFRPRQEGNEDVGDIHSGSFTIQCKDYASVADALRIGVAGAVKQAAARNAREGGYSSHPVALIKRRGKGPAEAYAVMRLEDFAELMWATDVQGISKYYDD